MNPKGHSRGPSVDERRKNRPRRDTRGPLDGDDPLAQSSDAEESQSPAGRGSLELRPKDQVIESFTTAQSHPASSRLFKVDLGLLLRPEIYHPISHLDIPPPFLALAASGKSSKTNFRAAAVQAVQDLLTTSPDDYERIFHLLYIRLSALVLIDETALASREAKALEDFHSSPLYRNPHNNAHLAPWELRVLAVRLQSLAFNDWRRGIMGIYELGREARTELANCTPTERILWTGRLEDLAIRTASNLVEMGDLEGAFRHLEDLRSNPSFSKRNRLGLSLALLYLRCGVLDQAQACLNEDDNDRERMIIDALLKMAHGELQAAADIWNQALKQKADPLIQQNLAVCYLYSGELDKARQTLEDSIELCEPFYTQTFNLCTIYELCTDRSREAKIQLANRIAKLHPNVEIYNSDFKL